MLLALLGALAVLGLGTWVAAQVRRSYGDLEPGGAAPAAATSAEPPAGGYTLIDAAESPDGPPLPAETLAHVCGLIERGRENEAAGAVRDATGCGTHRAEEIVAEIRRSRRP
ncbi:hypothetical protein EKD16_21715 [Streptomonospora litoralis]|uniref:Ribosomal protein L7/L12 C-terminal domain-containing protein n=2 Tax=Streptomonospora litoralis TaxID=2498135 RepID=A0A4P6Q5S4_9ACTN|nr:hypothetical protein EKD16_21715 [Streptomonospora litoralis]